MDKRHTRSACHSVLCSRPALVHTFPGGRRLAVAGRVPCRLRTFRFVQGNGTYSSPGARCLGIVESAEYSELGRPLEKYHSPVDPVRNSSSCISGAPIFRTW